VIRWILMPFAIPVLIAVLVAFMISLAIEGFHHA
jgi:hypothetical protein